MIINISLDCIQSNPWQTRLAVPDPEYIRELAEDIKANGLLQIPIGRNGSMDGNGEPLYELAFGHNRLAAYKLLADQDAGQDDKFGYDIMPVDIRQLTDEQMATLAWSENERRRDVNPIERAMAIQRRMDDFDLNQTQIAEKLGIARPTVSNLLRLLKLPEQIRQALIDGKISERVATALLPMYELPEETIQIANIGWAVRKPSDIERMATTGESSDRIREHVENVVTFYTRKLQNAEFGLDELFPENQFVGGYDHPGLGVTVYCGTCRNCDRRLKHDGNICLDIDCFKAKTVLHRRRYLAKAAAACGIEVVDPNKGGGVTPLPYNDETAVKIRATKCKNLCLIYEPQYVKDPIRQVAGHPHARIVCDKRNDSCTCVKGLRLATRQPTVEIKTFQQAPHKNQDELDITAKVGSESVGAQTLPAVPSADELAELARQARIAKKDVAGAQAELIEQLTGLFAGWLAEQQPGAFYILFNNFTRPNHDDLNSHRLYKRAGNDIARKIAAGDFKNVDELYRVVNNHLRYLELPEVSREKSLVEVLDEEQTS